MISFIVIGRNEGWKLELCFNSIFETIRSHSISLFEVIFVDSASTDNSIEIARGFELVRIFELTGDCNSAIARNVGAMEAKGSVLFFLDGDMELIPEEFSSFYNEKNGIEHPLISANFINYYYDSCWNFLSVSKKPYLKLKRDEYSSSLGGFFMVRRELWDSVEGMKTYMYRGEDPDFGLRLAKKNVFLFRKKIILVKHHTISYLEEKRKWQRIINKNHLYGRSVLYRENLLNFQCWIRMLKNDYSVVLLFFALLVSLYTSTIVLLVYLPFVLYRVFRNGRPYFENFFLFVIQDFLVLGGIFVFFPKKVSVSYRTVD